MHLSKISLALRQWGAAGFSPLDLFSSGEQGAWYDPSDINNYMGPELIVNGTFDSNTDGWTPIDATASVVGGKCVVTNTSNTWGFVATELQVTVGDTYALSIYFDTTSGYDAAVGIPGLIEDYISAGQTITYSATVVADTNPLTLYIGNADAVVGPNISFDNVSIRRIGEATMFQDSAGTTPVTADGQPVGLILDKSKGLVLGPELITNGTFDNNITGWSQQDGSVTWNPSGYINVTDVGGADGVAKVDFTAVIGKTYRLTFDLISRGGFCRVDVLGGVDLSKAITAVGRHTFYFVASITTSSYLSVLCADTDQTNVFDNFSLKEILGNHASQATAASRPLKTSTGAAKWTNYDAVDDVLNTTFTSSLGSSCTVCRANVGVAPTILTAQTIGTSYADSTDNAGLIIINRALTGQETTDVTAWLTAKGATS